VRSAFAAAAPAPAADADAAPVRLEPMPNAEDPPKPPAPNVGPAPPKPPRPIVVPAGLAAAAAAADCFFGWGAGRSLWSMYCQLRQMLYSVREAATSVPLLEQSLWQDDTKVRMQNLGRLILPLQLALEVAGDYHAKGWHEGIRRGKCTPGCA
jgi:hypothetical protein